MEDVDIAPESLFRPAKRRKFIRRRPDEDAEETSRDTTTAASTTDPKHTPDGQSKLNEDDESTQSTGVVRLRRPNPARKGGIGFSATSRPGQNSNRQSALVPSRESEKESIRDMTDRFTGNAGQTVDVDKHIPLPENEEKQPVSQQLSEKPTAQAQAQSEREPASLGKLHEIDLGQEAKLRNIERTEAATRGFGSGESQIDRDRPGPGPGTAEDSGKSRRNRRRTSADIERDRLVEEVLRESKLDVYDEPEDEPNLDDQAADDRIAEQFRRDFMDAIQSRRRARTNTKPATTSGGSGSKVEPPKGPKLGGSRSARAAMREMQSKK
ncbi:unnamed protein product [Penicillium pancosmium]